MRINDIKTRVGTIVGLIFYAFSFQSMAQTEAPESNELQKLLTESSCFKCHNDRGDEDDFRKNGLLRSAKYIDLKNPKNSLLYQKIFSGDMPKASEGYFINPTQKASLLNAIEKWILAGSPEFSFEQKKEFIDTKEEISYAEVLKSAVNDAQKNVQLAPDFRYFDFTPIYNDHSKRVKLPIYVAALTKLLNSLSWNPKLVQLTAVNPEKTVFRISLKSLNWQVRTVENRFYLRNDRWKSIIELYPYGFEKALAPELFAELETLAGQDNPIIRGDWFIKEASSTNLYYKLLFGEETSGAIRFFTPSKLSDLQKKLGVNIFGQNIENLDSLRAGFQKSGISINNRVIERFDTKYGYLWLSHDFVGSEIAAKGRKTIYDDDLSLLKNIFLNPLGIAQLHSGYFFENIEKKTFVQDGGEVIFSLPNGLQAYALVNSRFELIDTAPSEIVTDPSRPNRQVSNAISCMGCHTSGIILKQDEVRSFVDKLRTVKPNFFDERQYALINRLYNKDRLLPLMNSDAQQYQKAISKIGGIAGNEDPIKLSVLDYEKNLNGTTFKSQLADQSWPIPASTKLSAVITQIEIGGAITRTQFERDFNKYVGELVPSSLTDQLRDKISEPSNNLRERMNGSVLNQIRNNKVFQFKKIVTCVWPSGQKESKGKDFDDAFFASRDICKARCDDEIICTAQSLPEF